MKRVFIAVLVIMISFADGLYASDIFSDIEAVNKVKGSFRYAPKTDVEHQDGKVGVTRWSAGYSLGLKKEGMKDIPFRIGFGMSDVEISDSGVAVPLPGRLNAWYGNLELRAPIPAYEGLYAGVAFMPGFYGDEWTMGTEQFRATYRGYLAYRMSEKLMVVAGVQVSPRYEDIPVYPILGFIWKPNDQWELNFLSKNPRINYFVTDKLTVFAEGDFTFGEYSVSYLNDDNVTLEYRTVHAGGGLEYEIFENFKAAVSCGGYFMGYLRYREKDQGKVNLGEGFYTSVRLAYEF